MTFQALIRLMVLTVKNPAQALDILRSFRLSMAQRWMVLALAVSLSAVIAGGIGASAPTTDGDMLLAMARQPLRLAVIQFATMTFFAAMIVGVGRVFGGTGRFADAILIVAWIELILVVMQLAIIAMSLLVPPVALMLGLLAYGLAFYLILKMIQALHGFSNTLLVLMGFIGAFFVAAFILSVIGSVFGLLPEIPVRDL